MMDRENSLLVPAIAALVPESEQKSFSDKVLFRLGVLDSRLHLVHMKEAVSEQGLCIFKMNDSKSRIDFRANLEYTD